jgi:CHAT domain-containing protein
VDEALITYAPSARLLRAARSRARQPASGILAVYDPDLLNSAGEAHDARGWFESGAAVSSKRVTRGSLLEMMPAHLVLHFACHGSVDLDTPLDSGLAAASDSLLTLRDILRTPLAARLCVLSACDSAIAGGFVPDQVLSLPAGFLLAGAEAVVGTLWPVGDRRARALLSEFYKLWQGQGIEPAEALRRAQAPRRAPDGRSDAHWAAFIYVGA